MTFEEINTKIKRIDKINRVLVSLSARQFAEGSMIAYYSELELTEETSESLTEHIKTVQKLELTIRRARKKRRKNIADLYFTIKSSNIDQFERSIDEALQFFNEQLKPY